MCHLQELYSKYKNDGLVVLGCDASDDKTIALKMLRDNGATFPNIVDSSPAAEKVCFQEYQGERKYGSAVPMSYIIDRDGKVVDAWYDFEEGEPRAIAALQKTGGELAKAVHRDASAKVVKSAAEVAAAAQRLFQAFRTADYNHDWLGTVDWKYFPAKDVPYRAATNRSGWVQWVCRKFKGNPIADVRLGKVFAALDGSPTVHYELQLKDGEVLQGDLPFHGKSGSKQWVGWEGLDWHLHNPP